MISWKDRVIEEKLELDARLERLDAMIASDKFKGFDLLDQDLMRRQAGFMRAYSHTLAERIDLFSDPCE